MKIMSEKPLTAIAAELARASNIVEAQSKALQVLVDRLPAQHRDGEEGEVRQVIVDRLNDAAGALRISQVELIDLET